MKKIHGKTAILAGILSALFTVCLAGFAAAPLLAQDPEWGLGEHAKDLDPTYENLNWGFRGDAWGTEQDVLEERHELKQCWDIGPEMVTCNVADANRSLGDVPLLHVRYKFVKEQFYGVSLKYAPQYEQDVLRKVVALLGDPTGERDTFPVWELPLISVWASDTHFSVQSKKVMGTGSKRQSGGTF